MTQFNLKKKRHFISNSKKNHNIYIYMINIHHCFSYQIKSFSNPYRTIFLNYSFTQMKKQKGPRHTLLLRKYFKINQKKKSYKS